MGPKSSFSSVGMFVIGRFGVPLGCHWIASQPFLSARTWLRHLGVVANEPPLLLKSIDCTGLPRLDRGSASTQQPEPLDRWRVDACTAPQRLQYILAHQHGDKLQILRGSFVYRAMDGLDAAPLPGLSCRSAMNASSSLFREPFGRPGLPGWNRCSIGGIRLGVPSPSFRVSDDITRCDSSDEGVVSGHDCAGRQGPLVPYCNTWTFSRVTRPLPIIPSITGRNERIFVLAIYYFGDDRQILGQPQIFVVCMWLECPNPIGPRRTVAPARCNSRAFSTMASYSGKCPHFSSLPKKTLRRTASRGTCMIASIQRIEIGRGKCPVLVQIIYRNRGRRGTGTLWTGSVERTGTSHA